MAFTDVAEHYFETVAEECELLYIADHRDEIARGLLRYAAKVLTADQLPSQAEVEQLVDTHFFSPGAP